MRHLTKILVIGALFITSWFNMSSAPPEFKAELNTVNYLLKTYECEDIEFENWEDDDLTDSVLTVCLINSGTILKMSEEMQSKQLKLVGTKLKSSLKYPERYKSFYVIFVEREGKFLFKTSAHTYGGDLPASQL